MTTGHTCVALSPEALRSSTLNNSGLKAPVPWAGVADQLDARPNRSKLCAGSGLKTAEVTVLHTANSGNFLKVMVGTIALNVHELGAYISKLRMHKLRPFFLVHHLGGYDRSTDRSKYQHTVNTHLARAARTSATPDSRMFYSFVKCRQRNAPPATFPLSYITTYLIPLSLRLDCSPKQPSLLYLDFPCLAPPLTVGADQPPRPSHSINGPSDPLPSISPPRRPACSKRLLKRNRIVKCAEKPTRTRILQLGCKQQIAIFPLLPPPSPQGLLGQCVALLVEAVTRVVWLCPLCRRVSRATIKGRPQPLRTFSISSNLNQNILLSL